MAKFEKRVQKILQGRASVTFEDLDYVLTKLGWVRRQSKGGSSHYIYTKEGCPSIITVPFKRPHVCRHYVDEVIDLCNLENWGGYNEEDQD